MFSGTSRHLWATIIGLIMVVASISAMVDAYGLQDKFKLFIKLIMLLFWAFFAGINAVLYIKTRRIR